MVKNAMTEKTSQITVCTVSSDGVAASYFGERAITLKGDEQRQLSDQIDAVNFRLRASGAEYESGWHVAGDPTLLLMLSGAIEIELRNGQKKQFCTGEMFIAEDFLKQDVEFDDRQHGHRARVINDEKVSVLHLKLNKRL